jgi:hypothetical protein
VKKYFPLAVILMAALALMACASKPAAQDPDSPPWLNDFPPEEYVWGIGIAKQSSEQLSMTMAEARARTAIARQMDTLVQAMLTDYSRDAGTVGSQASLSLQEDVSRQVTNMKLSGAQPLQKWKAPDGTWWFLVQYKKSDARNEVSAIFDSESARYAEFKKDEALRMLDTQLGKKEPPLRVAE